MLSPNKHTSINKIISTLLVCLFLLNDISWAIPQGYSSPEQATLAIESQFNRITPFFKANELNFEDRADFLYAAVKLKKLFIDEKFDEFKIQRTINKLNAQLSSIGKIKIEEGIQDCNLNGYEYRSIIFDFVNDGKVTQIEAFFLKGYGNLPAEKQAQLRKELGIEDTEQHYLACPGLGEVWFANRDSRKVRPPTRNVILASMVSDRFPPTVRNRPLGIEALKGHLMHVFGDNVHVTTMDMQIHSVDDLMEVIASGECHVLGIGLRTGAYDMVDKILARLDELMPREQQPYLVFGDIVATSSPEEILHKCHGREKVFVVTGEGEEAMEGIIDYLNGNRALADIPNLLYMEGGKIIQTQIKTMPMENIAMPAVDSIPGLLNDRSFVWVESSRGCNRNCSFCAVQAFSHRNKWSPKPLETLASEIRQLVNAGVRRFGFCDNDILGTNKVSHIYGMKRLEAISTIIHSISKEAGCSIEWECDTRFDSFFDSGDTEEQRLERERIWEYAKNCGLSTVYVGLESASETQLKRYNKGIKLLEIEGAISMLKRLKLRFGLGFIPIDPLMSIKELQENIDFVERNGVLYNLTSVISFMRAQIGTRYTQTLARGGLLNNKLPNLLYYDYSYQDPAIGAIARVGRQWVEDLTALYYLLKIAAHDSPDLNQRQISKECLDKFKDMDFEFLKQLTHAVQEADISELDRIANSIASAFQEKRYRLLVSLEPILTSELYGDRGVKEYRQAIRKILAGGENAKLASQPQAEISQIVSGRENMYRQIFGKITEGLDTCKDRVPVLSIVGMPAMGKTVFAESFYKYLKERGKEPVLIRTDDALLNMNIFCHIFLRCLVSILHRLGWISDEQAFAAKVNLNYNQSKIEAMRREIELVRRNAHPGSVIIIEGLTDDPVKNIEGKKVLYIRGGIEGARERYMKRKETNIFSWPVRRLRAVFIIQRDREKYYEDRANYYEYVLDVSDFEHPKFIINKKDEPVKELPRASAADLKKGPAAVALGERYIYQDSNKFTPSNNLELMTTMQKMQILSASMPVDMEKLRYRGMRLTPESLSRILHNGLMISDIKISPAREEYNFTSNPVQAIWCAFSDYIAQPQGNFVIVVLQLEKAKIPGLTSRDTTKEDVPPEAINRVFVYNKIADRFDDKENRAGPEGATPAASVAAEEAEIRERSRRALERQPAPEEFAVIWQAHITQTEDEQGDLGQPDTDGIYRHSTLSQETIRRKIRILKRSGLFTNDQIKRLGDYGAFGKDAKLGTYSFEVNLEALTRSVVKDLSIDIPGLDKRVSYEGLDRELKILATKETRKFILCQPKDYYFRRFMEELITNAHEANPQGNIVIRLAEQRIETGDFILEVQNEGEVKEAILKKLKSMLDSLIDWYGVWLDEETGELVVEQELNANYIRSQAPERFSREPAKIRKVLSGLIKRDGLMALLFIQGLSSKEKVDKEAGYGFGLWETRKRIREVFNGDIHIDTNRPGYTSVRLDFHAEKTAISSTPRKMRNDKMPGQKSENTPGDDGKRLHNLALENKSEDNAGASLENLGQKTTPRPLTELELSNKRTDEQMSNNSASSAAEKGDEATKTVIRERIVEEYNTDKVNLDMIRQKGWEALSDESRYLLENPDAAVWGENCTPRIYYELWQFLLGSKAGKTFFKEKRNSGLFNLSRDDELNQKRSLLKRIIQNALFKRFGLSGGDFNLINEFIPLAMDTNDVYQMKSARNQELQREKGPEGSYNELKSFIDLCLKALAESRNWFTDHIGGSITDMGAGDEGEFILAFGAHISTPDMLVKATTAELSRASRETAEDAGAEQERLGLEPQAKPPRQGEMASGDQRKRWIEEANRGSEDALSELIAHIHDSMPYEWRPQEIADISAQLTGEAQRKFLENVYRYRVTYDIGDGSHLIIDYRILPGHEKTEQEMSGVIHEWLKIPGTVDKLIKNKGFLFFTNPEIEETAAEWENGHNKAPDGWVIRVGNPVKDGKSRFAMWNPWSSQEHVKGYIVFEPRQANAAETKMAENAGPEKKGDNPTNFRDINGGMKHEDIQQAVNKILVTAPDSARGSPQDLFEWLKKTDPGLWTVLPKNVIGTAVSAYYNDIIARPAPDSSAIVNEQTNQRTVKPANNIVRGAAATGDEVKQVNPSLSLPTLLVGISKEEVVHELRGFAGGILPWREFLQYNGLNKEALNEFDEIFQGLYTNIQDMDINGLLRKLHSQFSEEYIRSVEERIRKDVAPTFEYGQKVQEREKILKAMSLYMRVMKLYCGFYVGKETRNKRNVKLNDILTCYPAVKQKLIKAVTFDLQAGDISIHTDEVALFQVIRNILKNAIEATADDRENKIIVRTYLGGDGKSVFIQVEDQGIGISRENLSKIFTASFTTKDYGNGLGLTIVKNLVETRCGGTIDVQSELGKGTTFTIRLPITGSSASPSTKLPAGRAGAAASAVGMEEGIKLVCRSYLTELEKAAQESESVRAFVKETHAKLVEALEPYEELFKSISGGNVTKQNISELCNAIFGDIAKRMEEFVDKNKDREGYKEIRAFMIDGLSQNFACISLLLTRIDKGHAINNADIALVRKSILEYRGRLEIWRRIAAGETAVLSFSDTGSRRASAAENTENSVLGLNLPENLEEIPVEDIPRYLRVDLLRQGEELFKKNFISAELSTDAKLIYENPRSAEWGKTLTPKIVAEINNFMLGPGHFYDPELLSNILGWAVWKKAGLDPQKDVGKRLSKIFGMVPSSGPHRENAASFRNGKKVKAKLMADPELLKAFLKLGEAAIEIIIDDCRYRRNYIKIHREEADVGAGNEEYGQLPEFDLLFQDYRWLNDFSKAGKINKEDENRLREAFERFAFYIGYAEIYSPYILAEIRPQLSDNIEFVTDSIGWGDSNDAAFPHGWQQWHIDEIYMRLSAAKSQGVTQADEIWKIFRDGFIARYASGKAQEKSSLKPGPAPDSPTAGNELTNQLTDEQPNNNPASGAAEAPKTILVVDDFEEWRSKISKQLQEAGYVVLTADSAEDALRQIERSDKLPDFVVSDYSMGEMNGYELAIELAKRNPPIPIIVISSAPHAVIGWQPPPNLKGDIQKLAFRALNANDLRTMINSAIQSAPQISATGESKSVSNAGAKRKPRNKPGDGGKRRHNLALENDEKPLPESSASGAAASAAKGARVAQKEQSPLSALSPAREDIEKLEANKPVDGAHHAINAIEWRNFKQASIEQTDRMLDVLVPLIDNFIKAYQDRNRNRNVYRKMKETLATQLPEYAMSQEAAHKSLANIMEHVKSDYPVPEFIRWINVYVTLPKGTAIYLYGKDYHNIEIISALHYELWDFPEISMPVPAAIVFTTARHMTTDASAWSDAFGIGFVTIQNQDDVGEDSQEELFHLVDHLALFEKGYTVGLDAPKSISRMHVQANSELEQFLLNKRHDLNAIISVLLEIRWLLRGSLVSPSQVNRILGSYTTFGYGSDANRIAAKWVAHQKTLGKSAAQIWTESFGNEPMTVNMRRIYPVAEIPKDVDRQSHEENRDSAHLKTAKRKPKGEKPSNGSYNHAPDQGEETPSDENPLPVPKPPVSYDELNAGQASAVLRQAQDDVLSTLKGAAAEKDDEQSKEPSQNTAIARRESLPEDLANNEVTGLDEAFGISISMADISKGENVTHDISAEEVRSCMPVLKALAEFRDRFNKEFGRDILEFQVLKLTGDTGSYYLPIQLKFADEMLLGEEISVEGPTADGSFTINGSYRANPYTWFDFKNMRSIKNVKLKNLPKACTRMAKAILVKLGFRGETIGKPIRTPEDYADALLHWPHLIETARYASSIKPIWNPDDSILGKTNDRSQIVTLTPAVVVAIERYFMSGKRSKRDHEYRKAVYRPAMLNDNAFPEDALRLITQYNQHYAPAGYDIAKFMHMLPESDKDILIRAIKALQITLYDSINSVRSYCNFHGIKEVLFSDGLHEALPEFDAILKEAGITAVIPATFKEMPDMSDQGVATFASAQAEADKIHQENLKYTPAIPEKTLRCYIVTDSICPPEQWNMLSALETSMWKDKSYIEKVARLSIDDGSTFIGDLRRKMAKLKDDYSKLYEGYKVEFVVACPNTKLVEEAINSGLGVKALAFEPCKEPAQVEGVILALRALYTDDINRLRAAFEFLANRKLSLEEASITDINEFAKRVAFILPTAKILDNEVRRFNELISNNIKTAA
jgi:signal transduction histidine kinase/radical SAM superfamily enzyme YgiQ (UPF0313 family)